MLIDYAIVCDYSPNNGNSETFDIGRTIAITPWSDDQLNKPVGLSASDDAD